MNPVLFNATYWTYFTGMTLGWSLRSAGRRRLPRTGPVLILANHQSHFDPMLIALCATRQLRFLARSDLFRGALFSRLIRAYGAVPIDRGFGKEGLQVGLDLLNRGEAVVVFPEGERTHTGRIQPLKPGISLLLKRVRCPVVPVGIAGAYAAWPRHELLPIPDPIFLPSGGRSIAVAFGPVIPPEVLADLDRPAMIAEVEAALRGAHEEAEKLRRKPAGSSSTRR